MVQVVWFKRDLRVEDNAALSGAAARGPVLPLFVYEPALWDQPDMSSRHWKFVRTSLKDLDQRLRALGQPLIFKIGRVVDGLNELHEQFGIEALWSHEETGNGWTYARDIEVQEWLKSKAIPWQEERQSGVVRRLKSRDGWADQWDKLMAQPTIAAPQTLPTVIGEVRESLPKRKQLGLASMDNTWIDSGGRSKGLMLLHSFLHERGKYYRKEMSSPLTAFDACSRLSAHLAWGTVSSREVTQATWARMRDLKQSDDPGAKPWRASLNSFNGRLHWRCHFMQKLEDEPSLEVNNLHPAFDGLRPCAVDDSFSASKLKAWQQGETGLPFVDACMRALAATGWLNFRMRAMLMSVASYHLWLDWRKPGEHLARLFTDYEPGIHWSQVQMQSGTTGINAIRIYNPVKQGHDQDPEGRFIKRWLPELTEVPEPFIHEPWKWPHFREVEYPAPIVDHLQSARDARTKIWEIRKQVGFKDQAQTIVDKHGSRKSGLPQTTRRSKTRRKAATPSQDQLTLFKEAD